MPDRRVDIQRVRLRLRGVTPEQARAIAQGLGEEVGARLRTTNAGDRAGAFETVDAGKVAIERGASLSRLRERVGSAIGDAITGRKEAGR